MQNGLDPIQTIVRAGLDPEGMQLCAVPDITDEDETFVRLQLTNESAPDIMRLLTAFANRLGNRAQAGNAVIEEYDPAVAEMEHEIERLAISENSRLLSMVNELLEPANLRQYDAAQDGSRDYKALAIVVPRGDQGDVIFFKKQTRPQELRSTMKVRLFSRNGVFDSLHEVTFALDDDFDAVYVDEQIYIFKKEHFHTMFGYYEGLKEFASEALAEIGEKVPISNFEDFKTACISDRMLMRRLRRTFKSLGEGFDMNKVLATIDQQKVPVDVINADGKEMLVFNKSKKFDFMRLLEDGFLHSEMTGRYYGVSSKRERKIT
jgi:hypothetical protein